MTKEELNSIEEGFRNTDPTHKLFWLIENRDYDVRKKGLYLKSTDPVQWTNNVWEALKLSDYEKAKCVQEKSEMKVYHTEICEHVFILRDER